METTRRASWRSMAVHPRAKDAALVLGCLVLTAFAVKASWSELPRPVIAMAGVAGSLAQWPRRRWPALAAVMGAAAYVLSGNPGPIMVGLYAGGAYAPRRQVWAFVPVGWAGFAGCWWIDAGRLSADDAVWAVLATAFVVALGHYAATRHALLDSLRERAERAEGERLLLDERARAAERNRIAREMHDVLAHKVSLIALHAGALELSAGPAPVRKSAALIRVTAREALQELRGVLGVLHAGSGAPVQHPALDRGAPFADLRSLIDASVQAGQRVELHDDAGALPPATARVVFRVAQEGLTNAHRYAPDALTMVSVRRAEDGSVTVTVRNGPGSGAPMDLPGSGSGLIGLAERIRLVGGSIHSGPDDPGGWRLQAAVPWIDNDLGEPPVDVAPVDHRGSDS